MSLIIARIHWGSWMGQK